MNASPVYPSYGKMPVEEALVDVDVDAEEIVAELEAEQDSTEPGSIEDVFDPDREHVLTYEEIDAWGLEPERSSGSHRARPASEVFGVDPDD